MGPELVVAGWFVLHITGKLIATAFSYLEDQPKWHRGMKDELDKLCSDLPKIEAVVKAAEEGHFIKDQNQGLKAWLWQLKDAVDGADDVLDEIEYNRLDKQAMDEEEEKRVSASASRLQKKSVKFIKRTSRSDTTLKRLRKAVQSLNEVAAGTEAFLQLLQLQGHVGREQQQRAIPLDRETGPLLTENEVFGRDKLREHIIDMLIWSDCDAPGLSALSIVGSGGVGKTTLAQVVYNDQNIKEHFSLMMWVCVSNTFDVARLLREMIGFIPEARPLPRHPTLAMLQNCLKDVLVSKRFLLILDDVWFDEDNNEWQKLVAPLKHSESGSKILLTTRMDSVAKMIGNVMEEPRTLPVNLEGLEEDALLSLFNIYAFAGVDLDDYKQLQLIGKQIAGKLGGSPLAAKTVGGLLRSNLNSDYWERILNEDVMNWEHGENKMKQVLMLSYQHLPATLQSCFRFCSIYPQDHVFQKEELIYMWMGVGLVRQSQNELERPEDIGGGYLGILLKKSFFHLAPHSEDRREEYVMHDLMHDLARSVSKDECSRLDNEKPDLIPKTIRHLSIVCHDLATLKRVPDLKNLRTLFVDLTDLKQRDDDSEHAIDEVLERLRSIRVLKLSSYTRNGLSDKIGDLLHLRYLHIDETSYPIWYLPKSLNKLYHLQVIYTECHLDYPPEGLSRLINLRYTGREDNFPTFNGIGKLTCLQELRNFDGSKIHELKNLRELRALCINGIKDVRDLEKAQEANMIDKKHLQSLVLRWHSDGDVFDWTNQSSELGEQILDHLQPHSGLKELEITNSPVSRPPHWLIAPSLTDVVSVTLDSCKRLMNLPPFGQLRHLKSLYFRYMDAVKQVGPEFYGNDRVNAFPSLEVLQFSRMPEWEKWSGGVGEFPRLHELRIWFCLKLRELPPLPLSVKELHISGAGLIALPSLSQGCNSDNRSPSSSSCLSSLRVEFCPRLTSLAQGLLQHPTLLIALEELRVEYCNELIEPPTEGFKSLVSLQKLQLVSCPQMLAPDNLFPSSIRECSITYSFSDLDVSLPKLLQGRLTSLQLTSCAGLTSLPSAEVLRRLTVLRSLVIERCKDLVSLGGLHALVSLKELRISECEELYSHEMLETRDRHQPSITSYKLLPSSLQVVYIESSFSDLDGLLPKLLHGLSSLSRLWFDNCRNLTTLPSSDVFEKMTSLGVLRFSSCTELATLGGLHALISLKKLNIDDCRKLYSHDQMQELKDCHQPQASSVISNKLLPSSLQGLYIRSSFSDLDALLPMLLHGLTTLTCLDFAICENLTTLPSSEVLEGMTSLEELEFYYCGELATLGGVHALTSLRELTIDHCEKLYSHDQMQELKDCHQLQASSSVISNKLLPSSLQKVKIRSSFSDLDAVLPMLLHGLASLTHLEFGGCDNLTTLPSPEVLKGMTSLKSLEFRYCTLATLGDLRVLISLKHLIIDECSELKSLSGLPISLEKLHFSRCNMVLHKQYKKNVGPKWTELARIPVVKNRSGYCPP